MFRLSGVTGKPDEDEDGEDDEEGGNSTEVTKRALVDTLGKDRRDRVLAALYIVRQDSAGVVRQAAIHVWKSLVQNTPKTVREVLAVLSELNFLPLDRMLTITFFSANHCTNPCQSRLRATRGKIISVQAFFLR